MSKIALTPNSSGTGTFSIASPNSNTNRTLTLPDSAGELLTTTGDGSGLTGIVSFNPVAVTGTTPSLDVGAYNFFSQGALTANTTVSFASVPTKSKWSYSFVPALLGGTWDVSTASYLQGFSISTEDSSPLGLSFKPDGTKMYVVGLSGDDINEYNLSTAWDISTAVFLQLFSVNAQDTSPRSVSFKPDGLKMYVVGAGSDAVNEYDLSTAWDVSTAVFLQLFSVAGQDALPLGIFFKPDGLKMYFIGWSGGNILEYDLGTTSTLTLPAAVENSPAQVLTRDTRVTYEFITLDAGTTVTLIGEEVI